MGIEEYWIVDYAALEPRKFIGNPKQPTFQLSVIGYQLSAFSYQLSVI